MADCLPPDPLAPKTAPKAKRRKRREPLPLTSKVELRAAAASIFNAAYSGQMPPTEAHLHLKLLALVGTIWKDAAGSGASISEGADLEQLKQADHELRQWEAEQEREKQDTLDAQTTAKSAEAEAVEAIDEATAFLRRPPQRDERNSL
jgi:hypothetical protein